LFSTGHVADFLIDKDKLFARANLDDDELRLYEQVYEQTVRDLPVPDLVIYLQAPVDVLLDRVRRRGIGYERAIDREYLLRLVDSYTQFFHHYSASPLLVVNAAEINFVDREIDFKTLLAHIRKIRSGRHFFNPLAASA
jgi:deoxyadenosine/deoxycytidine kinase